MKRKGIIGSLLAVVGVIIVVFSFSSRINRFMEMHVDRSRNNAQAIDRNIVEVFEDIEANLQYIIYKPHFERMEHFYNETGDISQLARKVKENILSQDKHVSDMLILENNQILYSTREVYDYTFIGVNGRDNICFCTRDNIEYEIGIICHKDNLSYMLVLDAESFFESVGNEKNQMQDGVLLLDADAKFLMYSHE